MDNNDYINLCCVRFEHSITIHGVDCIFQIYAGFLFDTNTDSYALITLSASMPNESYNEEFFFLSDTKHVYIDKTPLFDKTSTDSLFFAAERSFYYKSINERIIRQTTMKQILGE